MSHLPNQSPPENVEHSFAVAVNVKPRRRRKKDPPFSLRLNIEERQKLEVAAAGTPLGAFIKTKLFEGDLKPRRTRGYAPVKDHAALAQVLGMIGQLRLVSNLDELAKAASIGALPLTEETEQEIIKACAAVLAIRAELMRALGYPVEESE
ncbi:hypothetical protein [Pelagibius sp. Alg239-R121]|uniref:hypothetical protein n=1 Tax=Pelagibius sp. Alg239-R121 TaxID=2993448 RepID=UPI0024A723A7|nr:hypothetical protein [Pelagibius sp. Alg239-R121]